MKTKTLGDIEQTEDNSNLLKFKFNVPMFQKKKELDINNILNSIDTRIKVNLE